MGWNLFTLYSKLAVCHCHFHFVHELVTIVMDCAILYFGILPWFWKRSGEFLVYAGLNVENEILHTLAFLAGVMFWSQITDLPFSLYSTFVIEARHGFNKQTIWLFFRDMIKGIVLAIVIGPPIVAAIIIIVQKGGPYLAIYLWAFMLIVSLVMMTIYPVLIAPLFNKFTPAYMYGFFNNKRIVLYDTLIQQTSLSPSPSLYFCSPCPPLVHCSLLPPPPLRSLFPRYIFQVPPHRSLLLSIDNGGRSKAPIAKQIRPPEVLSLLSPFHIAAHHQHNTFLDGSASELSSQRTMLRLLFHDRTHLLKCFVCLKAKTVLSNGVSRVEGFHDPKKLMDVDSRVLRRVKEGICGVGRVSVCEWNGVKLEVDEVKNDFGDMYEVECQSIEPERIKIQGDDRRILQGKWN
ncbi:UNVERIFIED_CONTAM: CAAX prenyl protease 1 [Sesamum radiatum]|uniref:CAAX prenyl protease 1 n=1 Tax=Sesamum radiatum TaxID=300843 RepID=A0AAW2KRN5_SESRA